jgi:hypothetical protein
MQMEMKQVKRTEATTSPMPMLVDGTIFSRFLRFSCWLM